MSELFVELFSEEIPARLQINARNELKKNIKNFFIDNQIKFNENFNVYSTPNRLVLHVDKFPNEIKNKIYLSKPGITGVGSIIFRDEEKSISEAKGDKHKFYKNHIAPYKGQLEIWYLNNSSIIVDLIIVLITAWVIIFPNSNLIYKVFSNLPKKNVS